METTVLPQLAEKSAELGLSVLDYEWSNRPDFDDDTQFYDGFHLDERYGLPQWTEQLFTDLALDHDVFSSGQPHVALTLVPAMASGMLKKGKRP